MSGNGTGAADRASRPGVTRRRLLKSSAALAGLAGGSGVLTGVPTIWAQDIKDVTLLHAGPPVAAIPKIGEQATKDLGFTIKMQATENVDLLNRFLSQSNAIDVGDVSITFMKYLVGRNVLQAIPRAKYKYWDQTIPVFTKGTYPDGSEASNQGVAPYSVLYATDATGQKFADGPSDWLTGIRPSPTRIHLACAPIWWDGRFPVGPI
jgi:putative spermidine/putrescine transport system substrate-binding protein